MPDKKQKPSKDVGIDMKRLETGLKELNPHNLAYIAGYVDALNEKEPPDKADGGKRKGA